MSDMDDMLSPVEDTDDNFYSDVIPDNAVKKQTRSESTRGKFRVRSGVK